MAKHKQIYCRCGAPANWYKKGKGHRVLVCNQCGVIANNPIPLALLAAAAPAIIEGASALFSKEKSTTQTNAYAPGVKPSMLDRAIELERLEAYKPRRRKHGKQSQSC